MKRRLLEPLFVALFAVAVLGGIATGVQNFVDMRIRNLVITGSCIGCASLNIPTPTQINQVELGNVVGGGGYGFTTITGDISPDPTIAGKFHVIAIPPPFGEIDLCTNGFGCNDKVDSGSWSGGASTLTGSGLFASTMCTGGAGCTGTANYLLTIESGGITTYNGAITSFTNSTTVGVTPALPSSSTSGQAYFGPDDLAAANALMLALGAQNDLPRGRPLLPQSRDALGPLGHRAAQYTLAWNQR